MDIQGKKNYGSKEPAEFHCDSRRCWKCNEDVCEERFEDLVLSIGP